MQDTHISRLFSQVIIEVFLLIMTYRKKLQRNIGFKDIIGHCLGLK